MPCLEVVICAPARVIEFASENIGFDLTIPLFGAELIEPLREVRQLIRRQTRDYNFKLFNAHIRILELRPRVVNPMSVPVTWTLDVRLWTTSELSVHYCRAAPRR